MSINGLKIAFGLITLAVSSAPAVAHEQAVGLTEISVIAETDGDGTCAVEACRLEVAHRLSIHDAESTLMSVLGARADLVGDPVAQQKFAAYVAQKFLITDAAAGTDIPLTLLGGEVERGYFWVYQEAIAPVGTADLAITQSVLMDAISRQTNRVNIKFQGEVTTLVFAGHGGPQSFSLP